MAAFALAYLLRFETWIAELIPVTQGPAAVRAVREPAAVHRPAGADRLPPAGPLPAAPRPLARRRLLRGLRRQHPRRGPRRRRHAVRRRPYSVARTRAGGRRASTKCRGGLGCSSSSLNIIVTYTSRELVREMLERRWRAGIGLKRVLIAGAGDLGRLVADKLLEHRELGFKVVGFLDDRAGRRSHRLSRAAAPRHARRGGPRSSSRSGSITSTSRCRSKSTSRCWASSRAPAASRSTCTSCPTCCSSSRCGRGSRTSTAFRSSASTTCRCGASTACSSARSTSRSPARRCSCLGRPVR